MPHTHLHLPQWALGLTGGSGWHAYEVWVSSANQHLKFVGQEFRCLGLQRRRQRAWPPIEPQVSLGSQALVSNTEHARVQ